MNEDTVLADGMFWGRMAGATTASMATSSDKDLRRQWIDDLIPESANRSNAGLRVEGIAHLMGNKNGRFGEYRFSVLLPWSLVRHCDRQPIVEAIDLDHGRRELHLVVAGPAEEPNQSEQPSQALGPRG